MPVQKVYLLNQTTPVNIPSGLVPKGAYNGATDYAVGDSVDYNGSSYVMYADAAAGTLPTDTTKWQILAEKGDTGAAGADSTIPGPAGADGLTVSVNSVTQVAGNISLTQDNIPDGTTNKAYTATEQSKLAGIEALADVTDATNVASAGAVMDGDFSANGVMTRTAAGTYTSRTITGTANQITVTNGDGVSGNPTLSLPSAITTPGSLTVTGHTSPQADSTYTIGTSSLYWSNTYTDRLYLNSTAYWDGSVAGRINTTAKVVTSATPTHTTGNHIGYEAYLTHNPTADGNGRTFGMYFMARTETTNTYNLTSGLALTGIEGLASHDGSGTMSGACAINAYARVNGTGTLTVGYGIRSYGAGAGAGSIGTYYGIYVDSQTAASTNYAIYTNTGRVSIGDTLHMRDKNIELGTTTGTKIGTATNQKLGFYNATPVVRPSSTPANATDLATAITLVNDMKAKLVTLGLIA